MNIKVKARCISQEMPGPTCPQQQGGWGQAVAAVGACTTTAAAAAAHRVEGKQEEEVLEEGKVQQGVMGLLGDWGTSCMYEIVKGSMIAMKTQMMISIYDSLLV
jgi:hypothetical protein